MSIAHFPTPTGNYRRYPPYRQAPDAPSRKVHLSRAFGPKSPQVASASSVLTECGIFGTSKPASGRCCIGAHWGWPRQPKPYFSLPGALPSHPSAFESVVFAEQVRGRCALAPTLGGTFSNMQLIRCREPFSNAAGFAWHCSPYCPCQSRQRL